ncbi:MAG: cytidine deaminase [Bacteroidales bacterium]|nr:cytidine deaminase [Bacteroidales bacterium]
MKPSKVIKQEISVRIYDDASQLTEDEQLLIREAQTSVDHAYAPYSNFNVGSAVLLENGEIICGSNQENAVYPLGLCAERVALFSAGSRFPDVPIVALALSTQKELKENEFPVFPCGSCRQVLIESETRHHHDIKLFITGSDRSIYVMDSVKEILPFAFRGDSLK